MKNKFKIGDRVGLNITKYNINESRIQLGVVIDLTTRGLLIVKWDDSRASYGQSQHISVVEISSEEECKLKFNKLEKDFLEVQAYVSERLNNASEFIQEANEVAKQVGVSLKNFTEFDKLSDVLNCLGWSTSSLDC